MHSQLCIVRLANARDLNQSQVGAGLAIVIIASAFGAGDGQAYYLGEETSASGLQGQGLA